MRKKVVFVVLMCSIFFSVSGCAGKETSNDDMSKDNLVVDITNNDETKNSFSVSEYSSDVVEFGVELYATNITSTGLTLVCTHVGGNLEGELQTDNLYTIEKNVDGNWKEVELQENVYWADEILKVNENESTEWNIDWTSTYGNLPAGEYRISKKFTDYKSQEASISCSYFVEFSIK